MGKGTYGADDALDDAGAVGRGGIEAEDAGQGGREGACLRGGCAVGGGIVVSNGGHRTDKTAGNSQLCKDAVHGRKGTAGQGERQPARRPAAGRGSRCRHVVIVGGAVRTWQLLGGLHGASLFGTVGRRLLVREMQIEA